MRKYIILLKWQLYFYNEDINAHVYNMLYDITYITQTVPFEDNALLCEFTQSIINYAFVDCYISQIGDWKLASLDDLCARIATQAEKYLHRIHRN